MKSFFKLIMVFVLILIMVLSITYTYAKESDEKISFFQLESQQICLEDKIVMYLNLSQIEAESFSFSISSNLNAKQFLTDANNPIEQGQTQIKENEIVMNIVKSEFSNIQQLVFYYVLPEDAKIGDKITIQAELTTQEGEETKKQEVSYLVEVIAKNEQQDSSNGQNNEQNQNDGQTEKQEGSSEQGNSEKENTTENEAKDPNAQTNSNKEPNTENSNNPSTNSQSNENTNTKQNEVTKQSTNTASSQLKTTGVSQNSSSQTVTYNGSSNNYLKSLTVSNQELLPDFNKTTDTYFITVENEITSLSITAKEEDASSKVCIYGNENLQEGENKILIFVTAENGNVRTYRIYVTK